MLIYDAGTASRVWLQSDKLILGEGHRAFVRQEPEVDLGSLASEVVAVAVGHLSDILTASFFHAVGKPDKLERDSKLVSSLLADYVCLLSGGAVVELGSSFHGGGSWFVVLEIFFISNLLR